MTSHRRTQRDPAAMSRRALVTLGLVAGTGMLDEGRADSKDVSTGRLDNPVLGEGGGVHHVTVRTRDWDRTLDFYQKVLGFHVRAAWSEHSGTMEERLTGKFPADQRWAYLDSGNGSCVEVFEDPSFVPAPEGSSDPTKNGGSGIVHFALRTNRIDQVCEHARALGASVLESPADFTLHTTTGQGPWMLRLFFIQGPSGEWIEILQHPP